jgi:phosphoribosylaminoimidazole carboxylase (NCAIR synthetase)
MAVREKSLPGKFYDYGKHSTTKNRKVGHINGKLQYLDLLKKAREE